MEDTIYYKFWEKREKTRRSPWRLVYNGGHMLWHGAALLAIVFPPDERISQIASYPTQIKWTRLKLQS